MYKVGQKVRVKSWEQMEKEYGLNCRGNIPTPLVFTRKMIVFCGNTYTIKSVFNHGETLAFFEDETKGWSWDNEMIESTGIRKLIERRKIHV